MDSFYIISAAVLFITSFGGYIAGFIKLSELLIKTSFSLITAFYFYEDAGSLLIQLFPSANEWAKIISFASIFVIVFLLLTVLFIAPDKKLQSFHNQPVNKFLGIIPGMISGAAVIMLFVQLSSFLVLPAAVNSSLKQNETAAFIKEQSKGLTKTLSPIFEKTINQTIAAATESSAQEGAVDLSFVTTVYQTRYDLEMQLLQMINDERKANGLTPLLPDPELCIVARQHSADMFEQGYFSHNTPNGLTPFDRIHKAGISYKTAGENLALAQTLQLAHRGLMNSPGHRANILNPRFGKVGIGILDGGSYGLMISQEFRD